MSMPGTPTLAATGTSAKMPCKRAAKGVTTSKGKENVDSATSKRRGKKVEPTIDASLKWQPKQSIFEVVPEHDWDNFMALTRKVWLETLDQGIDVGGYRSRVACNDLLSLAIFPWTDPRGVVTTVVREQIPASGNSSDSLDKSSIARRVELAVDKVMESDPMRRQPPLDLVLYRMAQIELKSHPRKKDMSYLEAYLDSKCGKKGKDKKRFFKPYYEEVDTAMKTIADIWNPRKATKRSQYEQFDRDEVAAADPSILVPIPDDVIHIITDCDGIVLSFRWPKALQWFFGDDLVEKTAEHIEEYAQHHQPTFPDQARHAMNPYWCRKHPEFQQKAGNREGKVPLGVFHFGCGGEVGKGNKKPMTKPDSKDDKLKPEVIRLREEMMREGVMPWITRAHKLVQGILDPELLTAQMEVMRHYEPELTRPTMDGDPFPLCAILVNPLTTDHRDLSDMRNGMALMTTTGDFGGADLCLRQVAARMGFDAGTITAVRGAEMPHCTTDWQGKARYSIVHTCGEQIKRYANLMDKEGWERPMRSIGEIDGSEKMDPYVLLEEETDKEDGERNEGEEQEEEEEDEAAGTVQKPIEISATPPDSEEEEFEEDSEEEFEEELEEEEKAAAGTMENPIELSATPSPVSKKRKRDP